METSGNPPLYDTVCSGGGHPAKVPETHCLNEVSRHDSRTCSGSRLNAYGERVLALSHSKRHRDCPRTSTAIQRHTRRGTVREEILRFNWTPVIDYALRASLQDGELGRDVSGVAEQNDRVVGGGHHERDGDVDGARTGVEVLREYHCVVNPSV
jgi:hypothetical protein